MQALQRSGATACYTRGGTVWPMALHGRPENFRTPAAGNVCPKFRVGVSLRPCNECQWCSRDCRYCSPLSLTKLHSARYAPGHVRGLHLSLTVLAACRRCVSRHIYETRSGLDAVPMHDARLLLAWSRLGPVRFVVPAGVQVRHLVAEIAKHLLLVVEELMVGLRAWRRGHAQLL